MSENAEQVPYASPPTLVHCVHHKCLTVFVDRCFTELLGRGFRNFFQNSERFYNEHQQVALSATSDFLIDLSKLGDYRISRFIRDPRDLVVSGYFYHLKGAEAWTHLKPAEWPWLGSLPRAMRPDESYTQCLQRLDREEGLIAEIEFRAPHFREMPKWPSNDGRIRTWKYEDIIGHEVEVMDAVAAHYGWPDDEEAFSLRPSLRQIADRWRAKDTLRAWDQHVRDPRPGQWREVFTPKVRAEFAARFPGLIETLGYESFERSRLMA